MVKIILISLALSSFTLSFASDKKLDFIPSEIFTKPILVLADSKNNITIEGISIIPRNKSEFLISEPKIDIRSEEISSSIRASEAILNHDTKIIDFKNSASFYTSDKNEISIKSEMLIFDLNKGELVSTKSVIFSLDNMKIKAGGLEVTQRKSRSEAIFKNAEINISEENISHSGFANELILIPKTKELVMKGDANFIQEGFEIKADLIRFSYEENKIVKSVNSVIRKEI